MGNLPIVSIAVPCFGLTTFILQDPKRKVGYTKTRNYKGETVGKPYKP